LDLIAEAFKLEVSHLLGVLTLKHSVPALQRNLQSRWIRYKNNGLICSLRRFSISFAPQSLKPKAKSQKPKA
jgi:hypothetical protein